MQAFATRPEITARSTSLVVRPLSSVLGVEVIGIDVARPLAADVHRQLRNAFETSRLLCFRDQFLTTDSLMAFTRRWGSAAVRTLHYETTGVTIASNADENGRPNGRHADPMDMRWHTDRSSRGDPVAATLLYGVEVPGEGGDTLFADAAMAHVYRHRWQRRDLLVWDGRRTLHCDTPYDTTRELRTMFRTEVVDVNTH